MNLFAKIIEFAKQQQPSLAEVEADVAAARKQVEKEIMKPYMDRNEFEGKCELAPQPKQLGNHNDYRLFYGTDLANGWVMLCDKDGIPIAKVGGVSQIYIAKRAAHED